MTSTWFTRTVVASFRSLSTSVGGRPLQPRWSPDGTMLVFGLQTNGQGDIYTVHADGSDLRQITNTPMIDERWPDWGSFAG
jgi:TolB protein